MAEKFLLIIVNLNFLAGSVPSVFKSLLTYGIGAWSLFSHVLSVQTDKTHKTKTSDKTRLDKGLMDH